MRDPSAAPSSNRRLTAVAGAMSLIVVLLMVQIWLLSATLESFLEGAMHVAAPAAIASGVIFAFCFLLYVFLDRNDSET